VVGYLILGRAVNDKELRAAIRTTAIRTAAFTEVAKKNASERL